MAVKARWIPKPVSLTRSIDPEDVDKPVDTLKRILMYDKTTFDNGLDLINTYVEQNISHKMPKSMISAFSTAINS